MKAPLAVTTEEKVRFTAILNFGTELLRLCKMS